MAAPVVAQANVFGFRDDKGQTARLRCVIGGATIAAVNTSSGALRTLLAAVSNAHVYNVTYGNGGADITYGTDADYETVEDKAQFVLIDPGGYFHRYQIPAPIGTKFLADGETVNLADTDWSALVTAFQTYVYGHATDTAPLVIVGGIRIRKKMKRRENILTKNPSLTGPGE
jgi:hypothetical protein